MGQFWTPIRAKGGSLLHADSHIARQKGVYKGRKAALTNDQAEVVRQKIAAGIPKAKVAREFKCSRETIYKYLKQGAVE